MIKDKTNIFHEILYVIIILLGIIVPGCDKEVSRSTIEPIPQGFIYVNSTPPGFTIYQNGKNTGRLTPDSLVFLNPGVYEVTLKRNYYKDTSVTIVVDEDKAVYIDVDYLSNPSMFGNLALFSQPPGAAIILDTTYLNRFTPDTLFNLLPAKYSVKYIMPEHRDVEFEVVVRSSETNVYFEELRDTSVWIDYQVFNSGIQSNSLTAIAVDFSNTKWIGSFDRGLIIYDEREFINFNTANSPIPSNQVRSITIAQNGDIWIGTNNGLAVFNGSSWIIYNQLNSDIPTDLVNAIEFDRSNNAWIGTSGGLARFDGVNWKTFNDTQLRIWVNDFEIANNNSIWMGTNDFGIVSLVDSSLVYYPDSIYNYLTNRISSVDIDQAGNVWFCHQPDSGRRSGVSFWDGNSFTNFFIGTADNNVNNIFVDDQNNKLISTHEGYVKFDQQNFATTYTTFNSLISSTQTNASVVDINCSLWITTQGGGLNKFKLNNLK